MLAPRSPAPRAVASSTRPRSIANETRPLVLWRWRGARAASLLLVVSSASARDCGVPAPSTPPAAAPRPPPPPLAPSSRRGAVVDPSGTDFFLGPGHAGAAPASRDREVALSDSREAERRLYRKVEAAPSAAAAVALCLSAPLGAEPLCLALFRGAVALSEGEAVAFAGDDGGVLWSEMARDAAEEEGLETRGEIDDDEEEEKDDPDAAVLARLQRALCAELAAATTITPSDAANVLWALASEACSPAAAARGAPAADARAVEAIAAAVPAPTGWGGDEGQQEDDEEEWQTADLVSALWGAGTLARALGRRRRAAMPATLALAGALSAALAQRWDFGAAPNATPSSSSSSSSSSAASQQQQQQQQQRPFDPPPRPRPCAEDLADAVAGVAAAAAAAAAARTTQEAAEGGAPPLLRLLESASACLHASLCNRHSFGGSGGAAPGAADTAKLFRSLASAALVLSPGGEWRAAAPSLPRALDALAALASQRARDRHRQMLSRPAHLAAAVKALADLQHGSLAVPDLLRLLGREAALGASGADGLAPPAPWALTLAERQAIKAAAGGSSAAAAAAAADGRPSNTSLPPERAPPTARWRPREAADLLGGMLRLGYRPPPLMCNAVAAAVLRGMRESEAEEGEEEEGEETEDGGGGGPARAALMLLAAFADAGWHPGDELAERLFLRASRGGALGGGENGENGEGGSGNKAPLPLADLLYAWAVLMASSSVGGDGRRSEGHEAARAAADALCAAAADDALGGGDARGAVRGLWSLAALGLLDDPRRFQVLARRALLAGGGVGGTGLAHLSEAQLAAVAEAAALVRGRQQGENAASPLSAAGLALCERALAAEAAEGGRRASRLFARDADALGARLLLLRGRGWWRLERDLAAWAKRKGPGGAVLMLLLLADDEDEGGALDDRAGGGLLPGCGPLPRPSGGLVLRARLALQEAGFGGGDTGVGAEQPPRVLILPRRQAAAAAAAAEAAGASGDDEEDDEELLSRALPL